MTTTPQMRVLAAAVEANIPVILWSEPGVGKSAFIESAFPANGYNVEPLICSHKDPTDLNGLPIVVDGQVHMAPPAWATRVNDSKKAVVFLDEFSQAAPMTQGSVLRLLNERWCGETRIGDHVRFILAANPSECSAGGFDLSAPAANRMLHLDWVGVSVQDYVLGLTAGWDHLNVDPKSLIVEATSARVSHVNALVGGYLMLNPGAIHSLPENPFEAGRGWASRRSWEMVARILPYLPKDDTEAILLAVTGCVGEGHATAFVTWLANADLPDPQAVLADPTSYDWAGERLDKTFVLASSIATLVESDVNEDAFQKAWGCVAACAEAGRSDIAVTVARRLMVVGQGKRWLPSPKAIAPIREMLVASGLMSSN